MVKSDVSNNVKWYQIFVLKLFCQVFEGVLGFGLFFGWMLIDCQYSEI